MTGWGFWLWIWMWSAWAHPMTEQIHGHEMEVYLDGEYIEVRYAAEIPMRAYYRELRALPQGNDDAAVEAMAEFDRLLLLDLERGLRLVVDGERQTTDWERMTPIGHVRTVESRFAVYQLRVRAPLPATTSSINLLNVNLLDEPAYFSTTVFATREVSVLASSLFDVEESRVIRSRSGVWVLGNIEEEARLRELRLSLSLSPISGSEEPVFREVVDLGTGMGQIVDDSAPLEVFSEVEHDPLMRMITGELSTPLLLLAILLAVFLGAAHALAPGHGKALVAAYLIGRRRKVRHAIWLGLIVTITHTAGVYLLALFAWIAEDIWPVDQIMPWLELISGLMVLAIGLGLVRSRWKEFRHEDSSPSHDHHVHDHDHDHDHGHDHGHDHDHSLMSEQTHAAWHARQLHDSEKGWKELMAMGVAGGLTPCPSALVLLLTAISLHRLMLGLVLVMFFSLGLALVVSAVGILVIKLGDRVGNQSRLREWARPVALCSAVLVSVLGIWMSSKGLGEVWTAVM